MATIKYLLQSSGEQCAIYCRLSIGRGQIFKRKTGLIADSKRWSPKKGMPIEKSAGEKNLAIDLTKLSAHLIEQVNKDSSVGKAIDGNWLINTINKHFGRSTDGDLSLLTDFADHYIKQLERDLEVSSKNAVKPSTIRKYKSIARKLEAFEKQSKTRIRLKEFNESFRSMFAHFLRVDERLSENTTGRYLKMVKTFALKAKAQGVAVHPFVDEFKGFTVKMPHVTLTFPELERIRSMQFEDERLESAKDWLLIGCYTGQRVSDLLRMNKTMLTEVKSKGGTPFQLIVLTQEKTGAKVQIPVHKVVHEILAKRGGEFPSTFGRTSDSASVLFNRYIKKVCKEAGIDELTEGVKFNPLTKRNESGTFPKWELASSHVCRRSFATNHYGQKLYPLPLLMNVTAHQSEKSFLVYIDRTRDDLSLELAEIWGSLPMYEVAPSKMRIVKTA
jgi:integrase